MLKALKLRVKGSKRMVLLMTCKEVENTRTAFERAMRGAERLRRSLSGSERFAEDSEGLVDPFVPKTKACLPNVCLF